MKTVPYTTRQRTPEPINIYFEFVDLWRLYRMCNDKGLSSRRTFILSLSIHEGCTSLSTKRTPKPTNIYFKFIISLRLYRTIHERGLRSRRTYFMSLLIHGGCIVCIMKEDSAADKHLFWFCHLMKAVI